jgi:hypothetical protein
MVEPNGLWTDPSLSNSDVLMLRDMATGAASGNDNGQVTVTDLAQSTAFRHGWRHSSSD